MVLQSGFRMSRSAIVSFPGNSGSLLKDNLDKCILSRFLAYCSLPADTHLVSTKLIARLACLAGSQHNFGVGLLVEEHKSSVPLSMVLLLLQIGLVC